MLLQPTFWVPNVYFVNFMQFSALVRVSLRGTPHVIYKLQLKNWGSQSQLCSLYFTVQNNVTFFGFLKSNVKYRNIITEHMLQYDIE